MLYRFWRGESNSGLTSDWQEIYICETLQLTFEQLMRQPETWVKKMLLMKKIKNQVQKDQRA